MRSPTLSELPPPPPGKTGWPWTEATPQAPDRMPDGSPWPRISIVTPSYNQGQFIEETIRSVLLQGYPDLEYIILDGGSSDESVDVIKKYSQWLAQWESRKDKGQSDAINKGLMAATGDIVAWVNTDDYYFPGVFNKVASAYSASDKQGFWYLTAVDLIDEEDGHREILQQRDFRTLAEFIPADSYIHSAGVFWSRDIFLKAGGFDVDSHHGFDKEYWMRLISYGYSTKVDNALVSAAYRLHPASKTVSASLYFRHDWAKIGLKYSEQAGLNRAGINEQKELFVYSAIRLAQNTRYSFKKRFSYLSECLFLKPTVLVRRDWIGTLYRLCLGR
jgi:glycosyltransferase involved in cell wall biosynthesis